MELLEAAHPEVDVLRPRTGVERAAESVLGDDTEALRLAKNELEELSRQLERELAQPQRQSNTNRAGGAQTSAGERGQQSVQQQANAKFGLYLWNFQRTIVAPFYEHLLRLKLLFGNVDDEDGEALVQKVLG
jgi:hypothetical protein